MALWQSVVRVPGQATFHQVCGPRGLVHAGGALQFAALARLVWLAWPERQVREAWALLMALKGVLMTALLLGWGPVVVAVKVEVGVIKLEAAQLGRSAPCPPAVCWSRPAQRAAPAWPRLDQTADGQGC